MNKCPQLRRNPPQSKLREKSNWSPTTKQAKHTTDCFSATNQQTTWLTKSIVDPTILNVLISMENNGRSKGVINSTRKELNNLARNVNLNNPNEIKALIARMKTGNAYKRMLVQAYNRYIKYYKLIWKEPTYHVESQEITVPTDEKINMLIATAKKPLSTKLQLNNKVNRSRIPIRDNHRRNKTIQKKKNSQT